MSNAPMIMRRKPGRNGMQNGFTLLEVLIALVVLSIGLLGLAGLQATGMRNNHDAYLRSQATLLVTDVMDAMRANRGSTTDANSALGGAYVINFNETPAASSTASAANDLRNWKTKLAAILPNGDGRINQNGEIFVIDIRWANAEDRTNTVTFTTRTAL